MNFKRIFSSLLVASTLIASAETAPKYVFLYIGDGMGVQPVMTAQAYNRDVRQNSEPLLMMQFPVASMCMTYSANSPITDSAAGGTALACGKKTNNYMIGVTPDSAAIISVARQFKDAGHGVGIVTSVALDDATPSAHYAHVPHRVMHYQIDTQAAYSDFDFMAGAGLLGMKDREGNPTDIADLFAERGIQLVYGPDEIKDINSDKVILLNNRGSSRSNIGYTIDSIQGVLNLPLIASTCLDHLKRVSPDGFFMMVEGGNIDHALHGQDGGAAIKEILNFDQSLAVAYNFYLEHPDETLIVVTADHDTGGSSNVFSKAGLKNPLRVFDYQKISKEQFSNYCKSMLRDRRVYQWEDMQKILEDKLGLFTQIPVGDEALANLKQKFTETFEMRNSADQETLYASFNSFAVDVFKLINDAAGMGFTTTGHSGNPVPVFAIGVGAEQFKSMNNNIDIPRIIRNITGLQQQ